MADLERQLLARASKAKLLTDNPEFNNAFQAVRDSLFQRIEACPIRDQEGLKDLHKMLKLLSDVKMNVVHVVNTGKVIEQRQSLMQRMKAKVHG